jgi:ligand-binding SRPBCC domain-containing protein
MIYSHRFLVSAPLARVAEFHRHAASMAAITPPPIIIRVKKAPENLSEGDEMDFTMWLGPIPLHWLARFEAVTPSSFSDRQMQGPFEEWVHRHTFLAADQQTTAVVDEISLRLRSQPLWWLVGMGMRLGLPILFTYRQWKTRRILQ